MNENSSKQVLLSILGIAVLVVAVVGVSFAFFSYSKTGFTNNVITTGEIYMYLTEGDTMTLTNAFPLYEDLDNVTNTTLASGGTGDVADDDIGMLSFSVTGKNTSNTAITYKVYLVPGTTPEDYVAENKLKDSEVSVIMSTDGGANVDNDIASATAISTLGNLSAGVLVATGTFPAGNADALEATHNYTINMYVNNTVKISDTDATVNGVATKYCAHAKVGEPTTSAAKDNYGCELDGLKVYSDMYYSVKVQVIGNTDASEIKPVVE